MNIFGKIMCFLGIHDYKCKIQDCIDEFGYIPMDGRMPNGSKCSRCGKVYKK